MKKISRRDFMKRIAVGGAALGIGNIVPFNALKSSAAISTPEKPVVSVVKIKNGNVDYAVRQAIDLLGGIKEITTGKERIMLKPNLVSPEPRDVTKVDVIKALAQLMKDAEKDVLIGEGSAAAGPNFRPGIFGNVCRTKDIDALDNIWCAQISLDLSLSMLPWRCRGRGLLSTKEGNWSIWIS